MEFRKSSETIQRAPLEDPEVQARAALRLLAQRQLHGARGLLLIVGSLLLVIHLAGVAMASGMAEDSASGLGVLIRRWTEEGLNALEWFAAAKVLVAVVVLICGGLVVVLPRAATILPVLLIMAGVAVTVFRKVNHGFEFSAPLMIIELSLAAVLCKAIGEALAFHRESQVARDHYRHAAIMRNRGTRRSSD